MPFYYVHVIIGERIHKDLEGVDLPDEAAARDYAREDARDLLRHIDPGDWGDCELVVFDGGGQLFSVPLLDVATSGARRAGTQGRLAD